MIKLTLVIDTLDGSELQTKDIRALTEKFRDVTYEQFDNKVAVLDAYVEVTVRVID